MPPYVTPQGRALLGGGGNALLFHDAFADTTGVDLSAHTPGPVNPNVWAWTNAQEGAPVAEVRGNAAGASGDASSNRAFATLNTGRSDLLLQAVINLPSGNAAGIVARWTDINNHWLLLLIQGAPGTLRLTERTTGTYTTRVEVTPTIAVGTNYTISLALNGSDFTAYLDGVQQFTHTSTAKQAEVRHGLRVNNTDTLVDDYRVYQNPFLP